MYATPGELRRAQSVPWLDFSDEKWAQTGGIHARGGSVLDDNDTMYTYQKMVAQKIADEQSRVNPASASMVKKMAQKFRQTMETRICLKLPRMSRQKPKLSRLMPLRTLLLTS